ncbi:MAG: hypothetical protein NTV03_01595 [Candidatus Nomurabacteria bacterium]|nr:hypothetical protein [Candidatus Nomurabacteria bacterium]
MENHHKITNIIFLVFILLIIPIDNIYAELVPSTYLDSYKKLCNELALRSPYNNYIASSATINNDLLITKSKHPIISGTFSNISENGISVVVWKGLVPLTPILSDTPYDAIYESSSDHGGQLWVCSAGGSSVSGRYYDEMWKSLEPGDYTVGIYQRSTIYNPGFSGYTPSILLTSATLKVIPEFLADPNLTTDKQLEVVNKQIDEQRSKQDDTNFYEENNIVTAGINNELETNTTGIISYINNNGRIIGLIIFIIFFIPFLWPFLRDYFDPAEKERRHVNRENKKKERLELAQALVYQGQKEKEEVEHRRKIEQQEIAEQIKIRKDEEYQEYSEFRKKLTEMPRYQIWTKDVIKRCENKCQTDKSHLGRKVEVHHLKSLYSIYKENNLDSDEEILNCKQLWGIDNGITLCKECHDKMESSKNRRLRI